MAFIPAPNCVKAALIFIKDGQEVVNVLHFKFTGPPTTTDMSDLATALHTFWTNQWKSNVDSTMGLTRIEVTDLASVSSPMSQLFLSSPEYGTKAGVGSPDGSAIVITHRTALRGRNYRGRTYQGSYSMSDLTTPGQITTALASGIATAFSWLLTPANIANFTWVVLSFFFNKAARSSGLATDVTGVTIDSALDSQRRRQVGRGV